MATELAAVEAFLAPVLKRDIIIQARGRSVVERLLADNAPQYSTDLESRALVVKKALDLLSKLHQALDGNANADLVRSILQTSTSRRAVDGLLDLISLEGIYPNLLPGVGVPIERRLRTVLQGVTATKRAGGFEEVLYDESLLLQVFECLSKIGMSSGKGLYSALQERTLVDIIAAGAQLIYAPNYAAPDGRRVYTLSALLDATPTATLFLVLTSLIHPATPDWLKTHISTSLSLLPLRSNGVRDTIVFIASVTPQYANPSEVRSGLMFSLEVFEHASKVLSSVPSTMSAVAYFEAVAPQLLALLDEEGSDMQRAAAYVVGNGILGRRLHGAPGRAGWMAFVNPLTSALKPDGTLNQKLSNDEDCFTPIVSSKELSCAFHRLAALTLIHPNPSLVKRLIGPLLYPIWCIAWQSYNVTKESVLHSMAMNILSTYFAVSVGGAEMTRLSKNLSWDGGSDLKYRLNNAKIEIFQRSRDVAMEIGERGHEYIRQRINQVADSWIELQSTVQSDSDFMDAFLVSFEAWLVGASSRADRSGILTSDFRQESIATAEDRYLNARIVQGMLERYKDRICMNPQRVLDLLQQILFKYVDWVRRVDGAGTQPKSVSLTFLRPNHAEENLEIEADDQFSEIATLSLSILDVLVSQGLQSKTSTLNTLRLLQSTLNALISNTSTPKAIAAASAYISSQISAFLVHPIPPTGEVKVQSTYESALSARSMAFQSLSSTLAPIRGEGIASLTKLIDAASPVLDIPATLILLVSLLQDAEEYIYLSAIKALTILAKKHPNTVMQHLLTRYIDREQDSALDSRLRIGEALRSIVVLENTLKANEIVNLLRDGLIYIASRRVHREKQAEEQRKRKAVEDIKTKEAKEVWGGEIPSMEEEYEDKEISAHLQEVLAGWEGQGGEEDIRIRTSSLSILGVAIEKHIATLDSSFISLAIDLAIAVLKIERKSEKDILRRAAALLLISVAKGLDTADEQGQELSFSFVDCSLGDIVEVLGYLAASERDDLTRGHEIEAIGGLQNWQAKRLLRAASGEDIRFGLEGKLKGLNVDPDANKRVKPKIEEVE